MTRHSPNSVTLKERLSRLCHKLNLWHLRCAERSLLRRKASLSIQLRKVRSLLCATYSVGVASPWLQEQKRLLHVDRIQASRRLREVRADLRKLGVPS